MLMVGKRKSIGIVMISQVPEAEGSRSVTLVIWVNFTSLSMACRNRSIHRYACVSTSITTGKGRILKKEEKIQTRTPGLLSSSKDSNNTLPTYLPTNLPTYQPTYLPYLPYLRTAKAQTQWSYETPERGFASERRGNMLIHPLKGVLHRHHVLVAAVEDIKHWSSRPTSHNDKYLWTRTLRRLTRNCG